MSIDLTRRHLTDFTLQCRLVMTLLVCLTLFASPDAQAQTALNKEAKVKAAYLFNFTKYIEWPDSSFSSSSSPVEICIDRNPTLEAFMRALVKNRKVGKQQRTLQIKSLRGSDKCHLSYLSQDIDSSSEVLSNSVNVSEANNSFDPLAILFFQQNGRLRFEINMKEIERLDIAVSSELLKLARIK